MDPTDAILKEIEAGNPSRVYLFHGDQGYLVDRAARRVVNALAAGESGAEVVRLEEEPVDWPAVVLRLRTGSLFGARLVFLGSNVSLFSGRKGQGGGLRDLLDRWRTEGSEKHDGLAAEFLKLVGPLRLELDDLATADGSPGGGSRLEEEAGEDLTGAERETVREIASRCRERGLRPPRNREEMTELREALEEGFGTGHVLFLTATEVDRRKALYRLVRKVGKVLEFSPERRQLQGAALQVIRDVFRDFGKRAAPDVPPRLILRIGTDLRRLAAEAEKLSLYAGDRQEITLEDVDAVVRRSREEQIFDLTEALGRGDTAAALASLRMLLRQGEHFLRIFGSLRKQFERILTARDLLDGDLGERWDPSMPYPRFESRFLPALQEMKRSGEIQLGNLHPYALYKTLQQAERFTMAGVEEFLRELLRLNRAAFAGRGDPGLLIEDLIHRTGGSRKGERVLN